MSWGWRGGDSKGKGYGRMRGVYITLFPDLGERYFSAGLWDG